MTSSGSDFDGPGLRLMLQRLSDRLDERGQSARLFVVGGAAMALKYEARRLTRDIDAIFEPAPEVRHVVEELGAEHGLRPDWLNDGAKGYMPGVDSDAEIAFESSSLVVEVASPEYLLAMKLHAARDDQDLDDAAVLFIRAGYTSAEQACDLLERKYPAHTLLPRHRYSADEVAARAAGKIASSGVAGPHAGGAARSLPPTRDHHRAESRGLDLDR
ncbi:MAG: hypothetical protein KF727_14360 [Microbacteriaceae bacterium]|nr:hypothetical protein [Microbacteriaceae bacterium]